MMLLAPKLMDTFQTAQLAPEGPTQHEMPIAPRRKGRRTAAPRMQADGYDSYVNSRSGSADSGRSRSVDKQKEEFERKVYGLLRKDFVLLEKVRGRGGRGPMGGPMGGMGGPGMGGMGGPMGGMGGQMGGMGGPGMGGMGGQMGDHMGMGGHMGGQMGGPMGGMGGPMGGMGGPMGGMGPGGMGQRGP